MNNFILHQTDPEQLAQNVAGIVLEKLQSSSLSEPTRERILSTKELCKEFQITPPTVIQLRKKGIIPCFYIGANVRFVYSEVLKALKEYNWKGLEK